MRIILLALTALISACASTEFNDTVYPYEYHKEHAEKREIKKIILAPVNFSGIPTRSHLEKGAAKVDRIVEERLRSAGYTLLPSYLFENAWNATRRKYGSFYDPTTGKADMRTLYAVLAETGERLRKSSDFDAIVFTEVVELDVYHTGGSQRLARWDGVSRKPGLYGAGTGVPMGFDWGQSCKAASVAILIYNRDMELVLSNRGGLDTTQAINLRIADPTYVRKRRILNQSGYLEDGVSLALHPFIRLKSHPKQEP